jgi:hypothetical protein
MFRASNKKEYDIRRSERVDHWRSKPARQLRRQPGDEPITLLPDEMLVDHK